MNDDIPARNWAGNHTYYSPQRVQVGSVEQLQEVIAGADKVRVLGSRHTFNSLPDTDGTLVRLGFDFPIEIDEPARTVLVSPAKTHSDLATQLEAKGWALQNLASLPHICAAGAPATGTHGFGDGVQNLANAVAAVELVDSSGELRTLRRGDPDFEGVPVHLGALGAITAVTLHIVPSYQISQRVFLDLPYEQWQQNFDQITSLGYSVSVFTRWRGEAADQLWVKSLADQPAPEQTFGATPATQTMHPIREVNPENATTQLGEPGPWHERLPHFRPEFEPASGAEIQSEFFVKRHDAPAVIEALRPLGDRLEEALLISEIRTVAADQLWLSPAYDADGEGSVGFHFTWQPDQRVVDEHLPLVERTLEPFATRPHWGKVFSGNPRPVNQYPKGDDFVALAQRMDPRGAFVNEFLERHVLG